MPVAAVHTYHRPLSAETVQKIVDEKCTVGARVTSTWREPGELTWYVWVGKALSYVQHRGHKHMQVHWLFGNGLEEHDELPTQQLMIQFQGGSPLSTRSLTSPRDTPTGPPATAPRRVTPVDAPELEKPHPDEACFGLGIDCIGCFSFCCLFFSSKPDRIKFHDQLKSPAVGPWLLRHGFIKTRPLVCKNEKGKKASSDTEADHDADDSPVEEAMGSDDEPFILPLVICGHASFTMNVQPRSVSYRCAKSSCRKRYTAGLPTLKHPQGYVQYLMFLAELEPISGLHRKLLNVSAQAVRAWTRTLAEAALLFNSERVMKQSERDQALWKNVQWDETFHGQRKYERGHRTRKSGLLTFVGGVELDTNQRVLDFVVAGVPNKSREQQMSLLLNLTTSGASISTDGARMYTGLQFAGREHHTVNHRRHFVADDGTHTNTIEGFWSVLKRVRRTLFPCMPANVTELAMDYQLCSYIVNARIARIDLHAAIFTLGRQAISKKAADPEMWNALVVGALGVFGTPSNAELEHHLEMKCKSEKVTVRPPVPDIPEELPLNQLQETSRSPAIKRHSTEEIARNLFGADMDEYLLRPAVPTTKRPDTAIDETTELVE